MGINKVELAPRPGIAGWDSGSGSSGGSSPCSSYRPSILPDPSHPPSKKDPSSASRRIPPEEPVTPRQDQQPRQDSHHADRDDDDSDQQHRDGEPVAEYYYGSKQSSEQADGCPQGAERSKPHGWSSPHPQVVALRESSPESPTVVLPGDERTKRDQDHHHTRNDYSDKKEFQPDHSTLPAKGAVRPPLTGPFFGESPCKRCETNGDPGPNGQATPAHSTRITYRLRMSKVRVGFN
jgi:hypothetical protein